MKREQIFDNPFIAFDNSQTCYKLLDVIDGMKHLIPKITILHVYKPQKIYVLLKDKGNTIFNTLKQRYPQITNPRIEIEIKQVGEKDVNVVLLQNFVSHSSSILFLGFVGSKSSKPRSKDLSSRIRKFVYQSKLNIGIIKGQSKKTNKVLFLLDGSQTSIEGLHIAIIFCQKFNKQLSVIHTYNQDLSKHAKHVKGILKKLQQQYKQFKFEQIFEQKQLLTAIKDREQTFEWIIMNRNGFRGSINKLKFIGSNTSLVLQNVNSNLIILN